MSALLRGARVFSNETENNASVKQEMTTNINVKLKPEQHINKPPSPLQAPLNPPYYPTIGPPSSDVNFTPPTAQSMEPDYPPTLRQAQPPPPTTIADPYPYQSPAYNQHPLAPRSVDLSESLSEQKQALEAKVKVLEALLNIYESAPILIKGLIIVTNKKLIEIIQILTGCEKVELLLDDYVGGGCCASANAHIATVSKIFIVDSQGTRNEFKVAYNAEYSLLLRHGVSLKIVRSD
jgi:hypothetical protein